MNLLSEVLTNQTSEWIAIASALFALIMLIINFGDRLWKKSNSNQSFSTLRTYCQFNDKTNTEVYQQLLMTASLVKDAAMALKYQTEINRERHENIQENLKRIDSAMSEMKKTISEILNKLDLR